MTCCSPENRKQGLTPRSPPRRGTVRVCTSGGKGKHAACATASAGAKRSDVQIIKRPKSRKLRETQPLGSVTAVIYPRILVRRQKFAMLGYPLSLYPLSAGNLSGRCGMLYEQGASLEWAGTITGPCRRTNRKERIDRIQTRSVRHSSFENREPACRPGDRWDPFGGRAYPDPGGRFQFHGRQTVTSKRHAGPCKPGYVNGMTDACRTLETP